MIRLGYAFTGSFCTFAESFAALERLAALGEYDIQPIFSENAASLDTRFGRAQVHLERAREITGHEPICTLVGAEPIGPRKLLDLLLIAPCTGNTLAKLANGIADSTVSLAAKAHLRNGRPLVLAVSTNDALAAAARNIGELMNRRDVFFVPFRQDSPREKPRSAVADFGLIEPALQAAVHGIQAFPLLL